VAKLRLVAASRTRTAVGDEISGTGWSQTVANGEAWAEQRGEGGPRCPGSCTRRRRRVQPLQARAEAASAGSRGHDEGAAARHGAGRRTRLRATWLGLVPCGPGRGCEHNW
jgi:hypothetical protein